MRVVVALLSAFLLTPPLAAQEKGDAAPPKPAPRAEKFNSLRQEYSARLEKSQEEIDDLQARLTELLDKQTETAEQYVAKLLGLVESDPKDDVALETIDHVLREQLDYISEEQATAIFQWLTKHHAASEKVLPVCQFTAELELTDPSRAFLHAVVAKNKNAEARAWALFALATAKYTEADAANDSTAFKEAQQLFERVVKEIPTDQTEGTPVDAAQRYLFELKHLMVGQQAPEFETEDLAGKHVKLSQTRGKVTLLLFWATWCEYCADLLPQERELAKKHASLAVVNVSGDDDASTVSEFLAENPLPGQQWFNGPEGGVLDAWNVQAFPTVYVIDAEGVIRHRNIQGDELSRAIEALVKEAEAAKNEAAKK
jgi:thiol-disulfide isomerase/thioredoxin